MDSFNTTNIRVEKAKSIKKHRKIQKIASLFRLIEIGAVLALISRFSIQLPVAVRNSSEYFKDLTVILVSPRFVFVLGNMIIITLFAKSGQFSSQHSNGKNPSSDLYDEFVEKSEKSQETHQYEAECIEKQVTYVEYKVTEDTSTSLKRKKYHRSQSEKLERPDSGRELRRSATDKCRKTIDSGKGSEKSFSPEDKMSNDEFRSTIEAFIARQKRFRIDEENSYIL
ncbi:TRANSMEMBRANE PROTEIN [Salix koriyanagi]|uniref:TRANSMEMBRANE PROTEIN n=1 Tax=Salix koriyanagi TaxID=2511006 RepID=A0A9Q0TSI4_9ROSI|nr:TRANSMEMBRANE PROTEIN [Salix koriyanagi]